MLISQQHLVCSLLQIYTKLRQLPRLFSEILSVVCRPALDPLRPPLLSEEISSTLRTCLLDIPPSQGLEICSVALETVRRNLLPDLRKEDVELDGERSDEVTRNGRDKGDASSKLFCLSQLLHVVLFNLKSLDDASPVPIVRQSQSLMKDMQQLARELILVLPLEMKAAKPNLSTVQKTTKKGKRKSNQQDSKKTDGCKGEALWVRKTLESALLLRYTLVEVNALFLLRCSKYTPLDEGQTEGKSHAEVLVSDDLEGFASLRPSCSPISCLLQKLLLLQQLKKALSDPAWPSEPSPAAQLSRAAHSILAKTECLGEEQAWNGQIASVNPSSYPAAYWYLVVSNLPLIVPHLSGDDVGRVADALVRSLLDKKRPKDEDCPPGHLTTSLIFSQLLQSSVHAELPTLFSATVHSLQEGIVAIFKEAQVSKVIQTLFECPEGEGKSLEAVSSQQCSRLFDKEALVQEILASVKTGKVAALLTGEQKEELLDLLNISTHLNPDGMSSEDITSTFLLLLFALVSTSGAPGSESEADSAVLATLLRTLTCLAEGRTFSGLFRHIHGGTLLQAVVASLFWHSDSGKFQTMCSSRWLDVISASRELITSLVRLIINRNSSVRLNLEQFTCYLTDKGIASRPAVSSGSAATSEAELGRSRSSDHLLLAVLTSFSQTMVSNLGRSKSMDQTLAQMLIRTTSALGQAVRIVLKPKTGGQSEEQPASTLGQAFLVEVVSVMLRCELSSLPLLSSQSVEQEKAQADVKLGHMDLYQGFCQQILKEICSAQRPMDFLVSSLRFLSLFYQVLKKTGRNVEHQEEKMKRDESDELYAHILQTVHRLMSGIYICVKLIEAALNYKYT